MVSHLFLAPIFCFLSIFSLPSIVFCNENTSQLLQVAVIFRHGDRTPVAPYPNDPYANRSYWPVDWGQLTNIGKRRHFALGQWFRQRYKDFLPLTYAHNEIYVRSTDVDRTLMSAASNLAGLYPPQGAQIWNPELLWQPIPIHTSPELEDAILAMKKPCPKYTRLLAELFKSPEFVEIAHKNQDLYTYLSRYSGAPITDLESMEYLYNTLWIEQHYNFTLPDWTKAVFPTKMDPWARLSFATGCYTRDLARLKTGPFFNHLIEHFLNKTTKNEEDYNRKFLIFSAHDTTIANLLNAMQVFQYHSPPYASTIIFELRSRLNLIKNQTEKFINIYYKNSTEPQQIVLKSCKFDCNLTQFIEILKPITVNLKQWHSECESGNFGTLELAIMISTATFLLLILSLIGLKCMGNKEEGTGKTYTQLPNDEYA